jgi:malonyl-CoA decarboxylase
MSIRGGIPKVRRPNPRGGTGTTPGFLADLIDTLTERSRDILARRAPWMGLSKTDADLISLGELLLSGRGEASGVALAETLLVAYAAASPDEKLAFLEALADRFGPDRDRVKAAVDAFLIDGAGTEAIDALHVAAEPRRQELIRRLNHAPGGTAALVKIRQELIDRLRERPHLKAVDADFVHLFSSWFNRGFLVLRPIDWTTPANILEKIIRYEAVHAIRDWNDLRNRLEPTDRRCYGFFHPQMVDEPLIFVEIALTREIPSSIDDLLDGNRLPIAASAANTAVFYSISNTQAGLGGVSFGNFLIKQVVEDLRRELPNLKLFVTLSPVPGFAAWLKRERQNPDSEILDDASRKVLDALDDPDWYKDGARADFMRPVFLTAAAYYFLKAKNGNGAPLDPVARFHLGNGARLEKMNFLGDKSENGLRQSHGLMVNYLYAPDEIEKNHEAYAEKGIVAASTAIRRLVRTLAPAS